MSQQKARVAVGIVSTGRLTTFVVLLLAVFLAFAFSYQGGGTVIDRSVETNSVAAQPKPDVASTTAAKPAVKAPAAAPAAPAKPTAPNSKPDVASTTAAKPAVKAPAAAPAAPAKPTAPNSKPDVVPAAQRPIRGAYSARPDVETASSEPAKAASSAASSAAAAPAAKPSVAKADPNVDPSKDPVKLATAFRRASCHNPNTPIDTVSVRIIQRAAERGHREALYELGGCHYSGKGVTQSLHQAIQYYVRAANKGLASAMEAAGYSQATAGNLASAIKYYKMAAGQNHAESMNSLGYHYIKGDGVPIDLAEGEKYFRRAAAQGHHMSLLHLGDMYYHSGTPCPNCSVETVARKFKGTYFYLLAGAVAKGLIPAPLDYEVAHRPLSKLSDELMRVLDWIVKDKVTYYEVADYKGFGKLAKRGTSGREHTDLIHTPNTYTYTYTYT